MLLPVNIMHKFSCNLFLHLLIHISAISFIFNLKLYEHRYKQKPIVTTN